MDGDVVGAVEGFAVVGFNQGPHVPRVVDPGYLASTVLTGQQSADPVEGEAVGIAAGANEFLDAPVGNETIYGVSGDIAK